MISILSRYCFLLALIAAMSSCQDQSFKRISGQTMATQYHITYRDPGIEKIPHLVERVLSEINYEVNTYDPSSLISQFNRQIDTLHLGDHQNHFLANYKTAKKLYEQSEGFFDPTIMPLVNYWGFGTKGKHTIAVVDSIAVDSMMRFVGFSKIGFLDKQNVLIKVDSRLQLDFSAIAKGYAVDRISRLLLDNGVSDFLVEIGGEVYAEGLNESRLSWKIGINKPLPEAELTDFVDLVQLSGFGLASSGNYRNYRMVEGRMYGHTIDPTTGYPALNTLFGVTIVSKSCMNADACATACMAMGLSKALSFINNMEDTHGAFYYSGGDGTIKTAYTDGFIQFSE